MSKVSKIMGLAAGLSTVAVIGVAVAQGVPPNPYVANPALGAGQQSTHMTSMGETGVPGMVDRPQTAVAPLRMVTPAERTASVAPAPLPAPAPAPVAQTTTETYSMGASEAPAQPTWHAPRAARRDRN